jgi:hypothetical protein
MTASSRQRIEQLLVEAERAFAVAKGDIALQRAAIQELYERGEEATDAEAALTTLLAIQVVHEMRCIRLRMELLLAE